MDIYKKIIRYKKKQKRVEIIQELYTLDPFHIKVCKVDLNMERSGTIRTTVTFNNRKTDSFICDRYTYSRIYNQLKDLI